LRTKRIVITGLMTVVMMGTTAATALGWPAAQPGQQGCIPVLKADGTPTGSYYIGTVPNPAPRGSHMPENGTCEGPLVSNPATIPGPPATVPAPPAPPQQAIAPTCGTTITCPPPPPAPVEGCTPRRTIDITVPQRMRFSGRTALTTVYRPVKKVLKVEYMYRTKTAEAKKVLLSNGQLRFRYTVDFRSKADGTPFHAIKGMTYVVKAWYRLTGYTDSNGVVHKDRTVTRIRQYRFCIPNDNDMNIPSEQRRD